MKIIAKKRLIFTDSDKNRVEISAGIEVTKDTRIPKKTMERFEELGAVGEMTEKEKLESSVKETEGKKVAKNADDSEGADLGAKDGKKK